MEDDDRLRELIAGALRQLRYTVVDAASASEALNLASDHEPIDLLVSDISMPGLDGRELARTLRDERPELRVIFTSGHPDARGSGQARRRADRVPPEAVPPGRAAHRIRDVLTARGPSTSSEA